MRILRYIFGCLIWILLCVNTLSGQEINRQQSLEEEIIRYLGYEEIPVRYVSLPYDVTMNHNVALNYMDIGFLLLMFVPLIFLWKARRSWIRVVISMVMLGMLLVSIGSSHVLSHVDGSKIFTLTSDLDSYVEHLESQPLRWAVTKMYQVSGKIYQPIGEFLGNLTNAGDHITYLLLLGICYLLYFVFSRSSRREQGPFVLGLLLLFYCFFMLILSSGIIWYGFLMFPLLYLQLSRYGSQSTTFKYYMLGAGGVFILMSYFLKVSGLVFTHDRDVGTYSEAVLEYNFGDISNNEVYEKYYPNIGPALDRINADSESLIWQSGSSLSYLFRNNQERVFKDGILHIFNQLVDKYKSKRILTAALKANGFKFLVVSPNLLYIDQTPERSLLAKFKKMASYLDQNENVTLLATDRIVERTLENGNISRKYEFGYGPNVKVIAQGTYAIFELK